MRSNSINTTNTSPAVYFDKIFRDTYSNTVVYLDKISNNKELAEDLAQEAYLKAWQKFSLLPKNEEEVARYILIIARNCFLDHLKAALRERKQQDAYSTSLESSHIAHASSHIEAKEQQRIAEHTINTHEESVRRIYLLNREYGLTYKQIALQEGISEKTVERYIGRVLRSLRARLATIFFIW